MRHVVVLAALVATACGTAPTCDDATCTAVCRAHETRMRALVPEGGALLSAWEFQVLEPHLAEIRAGVHPVEEEPVGVCAGVSSCERYLGDVVEGSPGAQHVLRAAFRVPSLGRWEARVVGECRGKERTDRAVDLSYDRTVPLVRGPDGIARLDPLLVLPTVPRGGQLNCRGEIRFPGGRDTGERNAQWGLTIR